MSDLAATNCGCNCGCENNNNCGLGFANGGGCSCILWILILSCLCGGNGNNLWGNGCGGDSCWLLILILLFCGGPSSPATSILKRSRALFASGTAVVLDERFAMIKRLLVLFYDSLDCSRYCLCNVHCSFSI